MVIKNAYIITMDEGKIIKGGYIVTDGRKITYAGEELPVGIDTSKVIDARGGIVMPGLINAHTHTPMSLLRGYADDMVLHSWLCDKIFPAEDKLDGEAVYYGTLLSIAEMIKGGTVAFSDMYFLSDHSIKAVIDSKIKANIAPCITAMGDEYIEKLENSIRIYDEYNNTAGGNVLIDFSLHAVYTCSPKVISAVSQEARKRDAGLTVHVSETQKENEDCRRAHNMSPTELLYKMGALYDKTNAAHCTFLSDTDIDIFKMSKTTATHNPISNLKLASGVADVQKLLDNNINIAIGTDGPASNNSLDMFAETKLCAILAKGISYDPVKMSAYDALSCATLGGARALNRQSETGKIKEGYDADIIILNADAPNLCPIHDPISAAVYSANSGNVETTIVAGEILMENGVLTTIDIEKIKREIKKSLERTGIASL